MTKADIRKSIFDHCKVKSKIKMMQIWVLGKLGRNQPIFFSKDLWTHDKPLQKNFKNDLRDNSPLRLVRNVARKLLRTLAVTQCQGLLTFDKHFLLQSYKIMSEKDGVTLLLKNEKKAS